MAATTTAKMVGAIAIVRRAAAALRRSGPSAFQAAGPISPIALPRVLPEPRPSGVAILAMRAIWTETATAWAASDIGRAPPWPRYAWLAVSWVPITLTDEEHLWACALAIETLHGASAPLHVADRIGALALAGDTAGIVRWQSIAACLAALQGGSGHN